MNHPTNSIDSELEFSVTQYRDNKNYESTQVTVNCKCGRGGWIRLQKHPDMSKYISRKEVEEAIDQGEETVWVKRGELLSHENIVNANYLRAKLLPPTNTGDKK